MALHNELKYRTRLFLFSSFILCTGWLWLSQGQRSDQGEHEPFVQTPSVERVKKSKKGGGGGVGLPVQNKEEEQQVLAAPRRIFHAESKSAESCTKLRTSKLCLLSAFVAVQRQGGGGEGGEGALINEMQEYKTGIREEDSIFSPLALSGIHHGIKVLMGGPRKTRIIMLGFDLTV